MRRKACADLLLMVSRDQHDLILFFQRVLFVFLTDLDSLNETMNH